MEQCKYCKDMFKRVALHINKCPTKLSMTPCPHCNKLFKRVATHVHRCPQRPEDNGKTMIDDLSSDENDADNGKTKKMTPCPHCKKMFKRVKAHVYRCPQKPEENGEMSDGISPEEDDHADVGKASNMSPCPHCDKMFKKVSAHVYRCPQRPKGNGEMPDEEEEENGDIPDEKTPERKFHGNGKAPKMTPCPHCDKMFKRVSAHVYRCPHKPDENGEIPDGKENREMAGGKTIINDSPSSSEEEEGEEEEEEEEKGVENENDAKMTPCPHCNKMFQRVSAHVYRCPRMPDVNGEIPDGRTVVIDSSSSEEEEEEGDDDEEATDMTPCPHCKKTFKLLGAHIGICPVRPNKDAGAKKAVDNNSTRYVYETSSISQSSKDTIPKTLIGQSEYRTNFFATPVYNSSPNPQRPDSDQRDAHVPVRSSIGEYLPSSAQRSTAGIYPVLNKTMPYSFSYKGYESWEPESNSPRKLKRPPIHGNHSVHYEGQVLDISGTEDGSLTDLSEDNSFYRSSGSEDSFSYLNQDLKRPPIHKTKSRMQREAARKAQFPTDEEEFFEFRHQVMRD